ncbi:hypothetical protein [Paenibacillus sp. NPDC093718]|uniref:hypothetical protein n=1 Tax=Paenibacillus sp. NPDC093718 TaxID=3390601 RepID=UPI003CFF4D02
MYPAVPGSNQIVLPVSNHNGCRRLNPACIQNVLNDFGFGGPGTLEGRTDKTFQLGEIVYDNPTMTECVTYGFVMPSGGSVKMPSKSNKI